MNCDDSETMAHWFQENVQQAVLWGVSTTCTSSIGPRCRNEGDTILQGVSVDAPRYVWLFSLSCGRGCLMVQFDRMALVGLLYSLQVGHSRIEGDIDEDDREQKDNIPSA